MAAAAGLLNHQSVAHPMATPMTSSSSGTNGSGSSSSASDDSATISANDFLTLLVTEMQNQDPTADTDPNEYINQLVNVNSLEQLIGINQTLTTAYGTSGTSSTDASASDGSASPQAHSAAAGPLAGTATATSSAATGSHTAAESTRPVVQTPGNLGMPSANSSAQFVAHSLGGRTRAHPATAPPTLP